MNIKNLVLIIITIFFITGGLLVFLKEDEKDVLENGTEEVIEEVDEELTKDIKDDKNSRANIFIAYYIYPELLEKEQWKKIFDNMLKSIWSQSEGLIIDKHSWPHLNCMAAICLYKLDKNKYLKYIENIIKISYTEILSNGVMGALPETLAKNLSYAPALALFIELIDLVYE